MTTGILHHPSSPQSTTGLLLREAVIEQAFAKVGIFGPQGCGKTTTAILLAIGLSKTYHGNAPIAFFDTDTGSDFVKPICDIEGVPLLVVKSRAFSDMKAALREAERRNCIAFVVDSYTKPWRELVESFRAKSNRNRLELHHMDALKSLWEGWTDEMLNSCLHTFLCGRLGNVWGREEEEDANGNVEQKLVSLGTKMKGEGEAGYEPNLLVEMEGMQQATARAKQTRAKRGSILHHAYVLKDRWRSLNGLTFSFKDLNDYKAGDYEAVFAKFRPHFDKLAIGRVQQRAIDRSRTSIGEFQGNGNTAWQLLAKQKQIAIENIEATFRVIWPGETGLEKSMRRAAIEALFDTRSWTAVQDLAVEKLEHAHLVLQVVEGVVVKTKEHVPESPVEVLTIIAAAEQVVRERNVQAQAEAHL